MHSRDYSEDTSRIIDAEVAKILLEQEKRAIEHLTRHRSGLEAVAHALLERETLDGSEVAALVDGAYGRPVHANGAGSVPHFSTAKMPEASKPAAPAAPAGPAASSGSDGAEPPSEPGVGAAPHGDAEPGGEEAGPGGEVEPGGDTQGTVARRL